MYKDAEELLSVTGAEEKDIIGHWTTILHNSVVPPETGSAWASKSTASKWVVKESLHRLALAVLHEGGPGSGNFGHAGRPGEVGGSSSGGEGGGEGKEGGGKSSGAEGVNAQEFLTTMYKPSLDDPSRNQIAVQPPNKEHPNGGYLVAYNKDADEPYFYVHNRESLEQLAKDSMYKDAEELLSVTGAEEKDIIGHWTTILHNSVVPPETGSKWGSKAKAKEWIT
jgi:hypothetical protein